MLNIVFILALGFAILLLGGWVYMFQMPGQSYKGSPVSPSPELVQDVKNHVFKLSGEIGERNLNYYNELQSAADYIQKELEKYGYHVSLQEYNIQEKKCANLIAEKMGTSKKDEIIVIGAHYDSVEGSPGANDNASGVASTLALAKFFASQENKRTLRFVAFVNEEPPYFKTEQMGSWHYVQNILEKKEKVQTKLLE